MKTTAVLLAAGQGTRMKSAMPKVLHPIAGKPMLWYALQGVKAATSEKPVVVVGSAAEAVSKYVDDQAECVQQNPQLGTAHAVLQARSLLKDRTQYVLIVYADMPLLRPETLNRLVEVQKQNRGPLSLLTVQADDPRGFGRLLRDADGSVAAVIEEYVATPEQLEIRELNAGVYCFLAAWLWDALDRIPKNPQKGEYYLTDAVALAVRDGLAVNAVRIPDATEAIGINTRAHLAQVEAAMRARNNTAHMLDGVTIVDPACTYVDTGVAIGRDTILYPNTHLRGETTIESDCVVGPNTIISDSRVGRGCRVVASVLEGALLEQDVQVGPFARLRRGAHLMKGVHMGNFGEVKDSTLGPGVKMGHFSYVGDASIGAETNIGAGTITCNFDGEKKHATLIGESVFIGSDTLLVAPVEIGDRARTGAGSVVTKDVPPDTLVVGMPARAIKKGGRKPRKS
jgi:bifunctional UDP-N-acetylglucosamine pyrophosphorylase/glucosamine-1-phosphate N-acetyltransferase